MIPFVLVFIVSFLVSLGLTPLARSLGLRLGLVDHPGGRRRHSGVISRLGGAAIFAAFVIAVLFSLSLPLSLQPPRLDPKESTRLAGLLAGCTLMFLFGMLDDRYELKAFSQYLGQLGVALLSVPFLIIIERVMNPFTNQIMVFPMPITVLLTVFWMMGMINTINFLDGLDGLAAGVTAIVCVVLSIHMILEGQLSVALLPLALLGAVVGFLPFNYSPARVFMGSTGSFFLGYALAALSILAGAKVATVVLVMSIPIADVAWQIFNRWRTGRPIGMADRGHLHHRLLDLGLRPRQIVMIYYGFCILFGTLALTISNRLYKLVALLTLGVLIIAVLAFLTWWEPKKASRENSPQINSGSDVP